jgi:hypothetical protein
LPCCEFLHRQQGFGWIFLIEVALTNALHGPQIGRVDFERFFKGSTGGLGIVGAQFPKAVLDQ